MNLRPSVLSNIECNNKLITLVTERPGHDQSYSIDAAKFFRDSKWKPEETFETGLRKIVSWLLDSPKWYKTEAHSGYHRERPDRGNN